MYCNTTMIGFAGFCKSDIVIYLSRILYILGEKVAIIDKSTEQEFRFYVPAGIYSEDRLEYRGIDIYLGCQNAQLNTIPIKNYTVVLVDLGVNANTIEDIKYLKVLFVVTDCNKYHTIPLSVWLSKQSSCPASIRIIRDIVYGKIRPRYIDSLLQASQLTKLIAKYEFPINEIEYSCRLLTQYDDVFKFTKIPIDFRNMLLDCITEIFEKERKIALKALKKAQLGG